MRRFLALMHLYGMVGVESARDDLRTTVANAAAGDVASLAAIVALYHNDMARVCAVICADPAAAEDAVQSAWPIAWHKLATLREPDRLRPWLVAIAANQARQLARRERRRRVVEILIAESPAEPDLDRHVAFADLGAALSRLNADERTLLALRFVADLESAEIGRAMGLSASGVRSRLERLLARLRRELADA